jgi:hypothetical protein
MRTETMNKQTSELLLVQGSKPVTEPVEISPAEAELTDAVIVASGRSPEITALVDAYEKRQRAEREAADAAADWRWWVDPTNAPVII